MSWHTIHFNLFQVSGGTFSRVLAGGSREELMGIKAFSTSLPALPLASVTSSLTSPLAYIIKAGSNLDFNVLQASLASSLNLISLCSKIFHSTPFDLLTTSINHPCYLCIHRILMNYVHFEVVRVVLRCLVFGLFVSPGQNCLPWLVFDVTSSQISPSPT